MDQKPTALVVDDEKAICEAMRDVLEDAGVQVYVANTAGAAEALFAQLVPDLVILDVRMPGMNGLELIGRLRSFVGWKRVPIVMTSGLSLRADREAAMQAGADGYLAKPFSSKVLRATVRHFLPLPHTAELTPAA